VRSDLFPDIPGWTDWQLMVACVFPQLDMQDEIDELELGVRAWIYIASGDD
jgi:hypothetical protein